MRSASLLASVFLRSEATSATDRMGWHLRNEQVHWLTRSELDRYVKYNVRVYVFPVDLSYICLFRERLSGSLQDSDFCPRMTLRSQERKRTEKKYSATSPSFENAMKIENTLKYERRESLMGMEILQRDLYWRET